MDDAVHRSMLNDWPVVQNREGVRGKSTDSLCSGHLVVFNTWFHFRSLYINFTLLGPQMWPDVPHFCDTAPIWLPMLSAGRWADCQRATTDEPFPFYILTWIFSLLRFCRFFYPFFQLPYTSPAASPSFHTISPSSSFYLTPCLPAVISFPVFLDLLHYLLLSPRLLR